MATSYHSLLGLASQQPAAESIFRDGEYLLKRIPAQWPSWTLWRISVLIQWQMGADQKLEFFEFAWIGRPATGFGGIFARCPRVVRKRISGWRGIRHMSVRVIACVYLG